MFWTRYSHCTHEHTAAVATCANAAQDGFYQHPSMHQGGATQVPALADSYREVMAAERVTFYGWGWVLSMTQERIPEHMGNIKLNSVSY